MKAVCTCVALAVSMTAGMAVGACLVMDNPQAKHIFRLGKRKAKQMLKI